MRKKSMMKWRVRKDDRFCPSEHEDVRRSLEVLDNVLAEFDDCIESWESPNFPHKRLNLTSKTNTYFEEVLRNELNASDDSFFRSSTDGGTSHTSSCAEEQAPVSSPPPPIPKRSPTTRLSERIKSDFIFQFDDTSMDSFDSLRLDPACDNTAALSKIEHVQEQQITFLSPEKNDDDFFGIPSEQMDNCNNCGCALKQGRDMDTVSKTNEGAQSPDMSTHSLERSGKSKVRIDQSASGAYSKHGKSSIFEDLNENKENESANSMDSKCEERIRQLNVKFQRVRELLRQKKIKPLEESPPSFIPLAPVLKSDLPLNEFHTSHKSSLEQEHASAVKDSSPIYANIDDVLNNIYDSISSSTDSSFTNKSSNLCDDCSVSFRLSPTVEDIPHLLPTDFLGRPQFGISYSLEDDLSPGVKEIQQTSTPKSDVSSTSLFKPKESGLFSTFSNSASSLGYVSSQSELELNSLSDVPDKVPLSSLKSVTLPNGLDRFPFYSSFQESNSELLMRRHNSQKVSISKPEDTKPVRNSSMELSSEKPKKRDFLFSRFSRKDKKSVKK